MRRLLIIGSYGLSVLLCLAGGATAAAQPPPLEPPRHFAVAPTLSTETLSVGLDATQPPRYDYRQARKVERAYNRHRRQFRRQFRRRSADTRRASYRKSQLQYRQYKREKREESNKPPSSRVALQPLDRRWRR